LNRDYYRTLGLRPDSSAEEIKKSYRRLAMKCHPDRNRGNPDSEDQLKELNEAYHVLGNEERRRHYDLRCRQPFEKVVYSYEESLNDDLIHQFSKFFQMGFKAKSSGRCGGMGLGRRGCGRWKR
jgi:curved DNA-binding protein CbpA